MRIVLLLLALSGCDKLFSLDHVSATSPSGGADAHMFDSSLDSDLIAHLSFDVTAKDDVLANNAVCSASACPQIEPGKLGNAAHFDGANDCVSDTLASNAAVVTVAFWLNVPSDTSHTILQKPSGSLLNTYKLDIDSPRVIRFTGGTTSVSFRSPDNSFTVNTWVHVAMTFDAGGVPTLYINGTFAANHAAIGSQADNSPLSIGCNSSTSPAFLSGLIDDVRVYSRVLTSAEIGTLANM